MLKCVSKAVVLALLLAQPAAAQEFEKGLEAYNNGEYAAALRSLQPLALQGERRAQHYLAFMYLRGKGVPQSDSEAATWFRRAAQQGHAKAQYNLGVMYHIGLGVKQNDTQAVRWFRAAADQGHSEAYQNLVFMRTKGRRLRADTATGPVSAALQGTLKAAPPLRTGPQSQSAASPPPPKRIALPARQPQPAKPKPARTAMADTTANTTSDTTTETMTEAARAAAITPSAGKPVEKAPLESKSVAEEPAAEVDPPNIAMATEGETMPEAGGAGKAEAAPVGKPDALAVVPRTVKPVTANDFHVQLGAVKVRSRAREEADRLNRLHKSVLGDLTIVPVRSDLGKRGIFYRLRAGPVSGWDSANLLCRKLAARKQNCIVANP